MDFTPIKNFMDFLTEWRIPGNVINVYKDGKKVFEYTSGYSDVEAKEEMTPDKYFYIYSCSKVAVCIAALQLLEKGVYTLDTPLYDFMPEFRTMYVNTPDGVKKSPVDITIKNLFTMTAGFNYEIEKAPWFDKAKELTNGNFDTVATLKLLSEYPLDFVPGTKWQYSLCHDMLAAVVELASGKRFEKYMQDNIFSPLEIDAVYHPDNTHKNRMCRKYRFIDDDKETDIIKRQMNASNAEGGHIEAIEKENILVPGKGYDSGGAGITTTVRDYAKFTAAIANGGLGINGERILERKTVDLYRTQQLDKTLYCGKDHLKGYVYAMGISVNEDPQLAPVGEIDWGGAAGGLALMDVDNNISYFYAHHMLNNQEPFVKPRLRKALYECMK